jgi:uncharacterized protein
MRISDMRRGLFGFWVSAGLAFGGLSFSAMAAPGTAVASDEFTMAERAIQVGNVAEGLQVLHLQAQRGGMRASLKLARLYSEGKVVAHDEVKACELYGALADKYAQIDRSDPGARLIAEAFRSWAYCYLRGAQGWEKNPVRAAELFHQAGVMLEDSDSLYELARIYLKGDGLAPNPRLAVHFLSIAVRKRHVPAQALLGTLMWQGRVLKPQRVNGLALMKFALESARPEDQQWIRREHDDALLTAKKEEEVDALRLVAEWKRAYSPDSTGGTSPLNVQTPAGSAPVAGTPILPTTQTPTAVPPNPQRKDPPGVARDQQNVPPQQRNLLGNNNVKPPVEQDQFRSVPTGSEPLPRKAQPEQE